MYKAYNDYELLYLVKEKHDHIALDILIKKYEKYIYKKIYSFFPREKEVDDYFQEGILCLYKAINSFDDQYNKTFMRYFEVLINRHLINIYHKNKREEEKLLMIINEAYVEEQTYNEPETNMLDIKIHFSSDVEQIIYQYYFVEGRKINHISDKLNMTKKQVYNAIYRVKQKIKLDNVDSSN